MVPATMPVSFVFHGNNGQPEKLFADVDRKLFYPSTLWNGGAKTHTAATVIRAEIYFSSSTFWK
jgi:hypothetical protein